MLSITSALNIFQANNRRRLCKRLFVTSLQSHGNVWRSKLVVCLLASSKQLKLNDTSWWVSYFIVINDKVTSLSNDRQTFWESCKGILSWLVKISRREIRLKILHKLFIMSTCLAGQINLMGNQELLISKLTLGNVQDTINRSSSHNWLSHQLKLRYSDGWSSGLLGEKCSEGNVRLSMARNRHTLFFFTVFMQAFLTAIENRN